MYVGDPFVARYATRDLWGRTNLEPLLGPRQGADGIPELQPGEHDAGGGASARCAAAAHVAARPPPDATANAPTTADTCTCATAQGVPRGLRHAGRWAASGITPTRALTTYLRTARRTTPTARSRSARTSAAQLLVASRSKFQPQQTPHHATSS